MPGHVATSVARASAASHLYRARRLQSPRRYSSSSSASSWAARDPQKVPAVAAAQVHAVAAVVADFFFPWVGAAFVGTDKRRQKEEADG
jgi:hypothetical protein